MTLAKHFEAIGTAPMTPCKPIILSGPMVRAILDGRKTQTRRILKPQPVIYPSLAPSFQWGKYLGMWPDDWFGMGNEIDNALHYSPGDQLWVREVWQHARQKHCSCPQGDEPSPCDDWLDGNGCRSNRGDVIWRADGETVRPWKSPIHMPRWASRITLYVTAVKVERLKDISEDDAKAEGVEVGKPLSGIPESGGDIYHDGVTDPIDGWTRDPVEAFKHLWNSIHGPAAWDANPWVAAYSFRRGMG